MDEGSGLDRRAVDEALEELDFLFIDNDPTRLIIDKSAELGTGGSGDVYQGDLFVALAQQTIRVAVKIMRSHESKDLRVAYRLLREISVWADLRHQNILPLIGFHLSSKLDVALLVCPLEPLGSIECYLKTHIVDIPGRIEFVVQVARGIAYLHSLNPPVTHGDIKAANTLVNQQREAALCDFGLAKSNFRTGLETSDNFAGSLLFCSPELFDGAGRSPASDMWAMGCIVLEIVLGVKPFSPVVQPLRIIKMIADGNLPSSEEALRSPHDLWDGVVHCWHLEPKDRIHASEFLEYWDLKTRNPHGLDSSKPICPSEACKDRWQRLSGWKILHTLIAATGIFAVLSWALKIYRITKSCYYSRSLGRELLALEALPQSKLAGWSANPARVSCLMGTRTAVLKEIRAWLADTSSDAPPFFELDGIAGIGKTTIAHTLAEEAARDGYLVASFFFSREGEAELSNPALVFPTLAYQLGNFSPSFLLHFGRAAEASLSAAYESLETQLHKLIVTPLQYVRASKPLLIVLDALDECQKGGAKEFLRLLLSEVSKVPVPLKIFMTARPEPHLRSIFSHAENLRRVILHDIEASVVKNDIRLYLRTSFAEIPKRLKLPIGRTWARHDEIEALVERAETLFIVAATFARFAGDDAVRNPRKQLDLLLQRDETSFTRPNHTIDELYLQILRKIRSTTGSSLIIERLQLMVGAIILLHNPIPVAAIEQLLGLSAGDGSRALHHLHSLISIPRSPNECPRIHHASFPDFITDPLRCTETDFCVQPAIHEARLAARCLELTIFSLDCEPIKQGLELKVMNRERESRVIRRELESGVMTQALGYASVRWGYHLWQAGSDAGRVVDLVGLSISRCLMWWLEAVRPRAPDECLTEACSWAILCRARDLASLVAALELDAGRPQKAVEVIEHAHATSASQLEQYRTMLGQLQASSPELLSELLSLNSQIQRLMNSSGESGLSNSVGALDPDAARRHRVLSQHWYDVLMRIRELPGFQAFLKPAPFDILQRAAAKGPVIMINVTRLRSDAIIILEVGEPVVISLPKATPGTIDVLSERLKEVVISSGVRLRGMSFATPLNRDLRDIWIYIVEPIVYYLERTLNLPTVSRIWWNPTTAVWSFPLHAAGNYDTAEENLPDRFVSSYTPSLLTLLRSEAPAREAPRPTLLLVAHAEGEGESLLDDVHREVNAITELAPHATVLEGEACTTDAVLMDLKETSWVHFACHARQDATDPFKSSILLQSHKTKSITLLDIIRNDFPKAELAFVSTCDSAFWMAHGHTNHLVAGMLFSGFRSAIGSMGAMADEDGPVLAKEFYKYMFRNGPEGANYRDSARALNVATKVLRRKRVPLERWIGFVHYGM
ncbi:hypothetical protein FRB93_003098 [Tulasnella sp. JGI-2019a]|nr:hypothetical protein FRB93_003098 [Tulasnella sp. JGI-2019a]